MRWFICSIEANIKHICELKDKAAERSGRKGEDVLLVAVTKLHSTDEINEAIDCGITDIGENKVQEIMDKYDRVKPGPLASDRPLADKQGKIHKSTRFV